MAKKPKTQVNIARYPFTVQKMKEGIELTLHDCILRGELLRERPELGLKDSFQMNQEKTELNYIPISAKKFTAMDITNLSFGFFRRLG